VLDIVGYLEELAFASEGTIEVLGIKSERSFVLLQFFKKLRVLKCNHNPRTTYYLPHSIERVVVSGMIYRVDELKNLTYVRGLELDRSSFTIPSHWVHLKSINQYSMDENKEKKYLVPQNSKLRSVTGLLKREPWCDCPELESVTHGAKKSFVPPPSIRKLKGAFQVEHIRELCHLARFDGSFASSLQKVPDVVQTLVLKCGKEEIVLGKRTKECHLLWAHEKVVKVDLRHCREEQIIVCTECNITFSHDRRYHTDNVGDLTASLFIRGPTGYSPLQNLCLSANVAKIFSFVRRVKVWTIRKRLSSWNK